MDFLTELTSLIPMQIAGIDTLYIALGFVVILLLLMIMMKSKKSKSKNKLPDIDLEEIEAKNAQSTDEEEFEEAITQIEDEKEETPVVEESVNEEVVEEQVEEVIEEITPNSNQTQNRKKRDSRRNGKKISKSDFSDFTGRRLLIAEDNLINQKVLKGVLNESGIDVVMADDGQFVLDILAKDQDFEIVLMDAHMPRIDGFEATREIRKNSKYDHIAVVALSGDTAADDVRHMREAGMEEHLEKPLKMDALYDVMSMYYTLDDDEKVVEVIEETVVVEPELEDKEIDVNDLASLDYDLGLEICGNDEKMYNQLLKEFFESYKNSTKQLHALMVSKNYADSQKLLIDVKGTASNLGAKQFIYTVDKFLEALDSENSSIYSSLFKDYQAHLLTLLKSIKNVYKV